MKRGELREWIRMERQVTSGEMKRGEVCEWNKVV